MNKLILFDWGNVLLDSESSSYSIFDARRDIASELKPYNKKLFMKMFDKGKFWITSGDDLYKFIYKYLTGSMCCCTVDDFKKCYLKYYNKVLWYENMVSLVNTLLTDSRFNIGILSTLCEMDWELLKSKLYMDKVDYRFFSFNLGIQKPYKRIYEMVEVITGYDKKDILFIDDREDNIKEAKSRGWNTILATGNDFEKIQQNCYSFMNIDYKSEQLMKTSFWDRISGDY